MGVLGETSQRVKVQPFGQNWKRGLLQVISADSLAMESANT